MRWPDGIESAAIAAGIKSSGELDLAALRTRGPVAWAGTFTQNAAAAAPVRWSRCLLGEPVQALVVNSGNANACTGAAGEKAVRETARAAAEAFGCRPDEVLVASTGVIGMPLPVDRIAAALPRISESLDPEMNSFAQAILTTDTVTKIAEAKLDGPRIVGVAKGAAMLAPNMATMLAFVATDAAFSHEELQHFLGDAVEQSFNRISVDACESTNDSVFLLATGKRSTDPALFAEGLRNVCSSLAQQMVRDAEGGSKLLHIRVKGALDDRHGVRLAHAVASSVLWKAACYGGDPNWGRVLSALGSADRTLDLSELEISIGDVVVFGKGEPAPNREDAAIPLSRDEVEVTCRVGFGPAEAEVLSCDLSPEYITLNASGTS